MEESSISLVNILTLLVVSDKSLGDGLSDGIDLGYMTTTVYTNSDVNARELFLLPKK